MLTLLDRCVRAPRRLLTVALLATAVTATACKDSTSPEEAEPNVTSMILTFSNGQTATVTGVGATPTLRIPVGATTVTAVFLRADNTPDPIVTTAVFRLDVVPPAGNVVFARNSSNAFSGTLTATTATTTAVPVTFSLLHVAEGHNDFGPFTVNVTVGN